MLGWGLIHAPYAPEHTYRAIPSPKTPIEGKGDDNWRTGDGTETKQPPPAQDRG